MLPPDKTRSSFYWLVIMMVIGIGWCVIGMPVINSTCRLFGIAPIVEFENVLKLFQELKDIILAMIAAVCGKGIGDRYIDFRTCQMPKEAKRDPGERTRSSDKKQ